MASWATLKAAIANIIKTNGNQEITGQVLQNALNNIISSVGENASFVDVATPTTNPGTPDGPVFYLATRNGTYSNFGGIVVEDDAVILLYNGSAWIKKATGIALTESVLNLVAKNAIIDPQTLNSYNKIDPNRLNLGKSINSSTGAETVQPNYFNTNFIDVLGIDKVYSQIYVNGRMYAYDKNFKFISAVSANTSEKSYTLPENTRHIRLACNRSLIGSNSLYLYIEEETAYYAYGITKDSIHADEKIVKVEKTLSKELEYKSIPSTIEIIKPYNNWVRDKYNLGYYDADTGEFKENKSYLTSEKLTVKKGNVIQCGYFLLQGSYVRYNPNQFINIWSSDGFERINNSSFPSFPFQVTKDCEISYTWYNTKEPQEFEMNKQLGMLCISPTPPSSYEEYFEPYKKVTFEKEKVNIPYKQDNLIAGNGIKIKNNIISVIQDGSTQDGNSIEGEKISSLIGYPPVYKGFYELESRKATENYSAIPNIENPKEILFVKNGSINQESVPLFCGHRIAIDQVSYVYSIDKTVNNAGTRGGILPMQFKFNGDAIEIGHRGMLSLNIIFKEDNKWYLLSEKAIKIETQNGFRSYTIVKFQEAKEREFYVLNNSLLYSLRYNNKYILESFSTKDLAIYAGSSITEASAGGEFPPMGWASICAWMLGLECINLGVGQRGMVTDNTTDRPSVANAITDITYFTKAKYVFIGGAINDQYNDEYKKKVQAFISTLKSEMPNAIIVMLGEYTPQPDSNTPGNTHELRNQAVKEVALEENIPFIDMQNYESYNQLQTLIIKDTPWITGTFVSSSDDKMNKIGNCAILYNHESGSIDHTHPGRIGHKYVGTRVANAMLEILKYI